MNRFCTSAAALFLGTLFAGCTSTPVSPTPAAATPSAATAPPPSMPPTAGTSSSVGSAAVATVTLAPHLDPSSPISKERSVYFDYDDFTIKHDYISLVERQGKYLLSKPTLTVRIEGHADERGSTEYNLALGQKRAEAVLKALELYGARDAQMEAVSWGKERPKHPGHDEAAWAQNRRADVSYSRP